MSNSPAISVVIPTYNAPDLLEQTLASVFTQTFGDFEIIVINDGSTDDTAGRLEKYGNDGRFRLINQKNTGIGIARNRGIDESRGKYVALLDHDDLWMPEKLQTQFEYMEAHPECAGCSVRWAYSTSPQTLVCNFASLIEPDGHVRRPIRALAESNLFLTSSSLLFNRKLSEGLQYMPYPRCIEDTSFMVKLFARGAFGIAGDKIQMIYRWHQSNYSSQADFFYNGIQMLRRIDKEGEFDCLNREQRADWKKFMAHIGRNAAVRQLDAGLRLRGFKTYFREMPHQLTRWRFLFGFPIMAMAGKWARLRSGT